MKRSEELPETGSPFLDWSATESVLSGAGGPDFPKENDWFVHSGSRVTSTHSTKQRILVRLTMVGSLLGRL